MFDAANWQPISGATSSSVSVTPASLTHDRVVVSNAAASTTSDVASVTPTALATEPGSGVSYGDLTGDGSVNTADVAPLRAVLAGLQTLAVPHTVADLDGSGSVDALDLSLLAGFDAGTVSCLPRFPILSMSTSTQVSSTTRFPPTTQQGAPNPTQYFFYTPEMNLLSQTELRAAGGRPEPAIDYLWFNGTPVAEERLATNETRYTHTDPLGTPFLQTTPTGTPVWHVDYEPFGAIYTTRTGSAAEQRLRFPGQEFDEQTPERAYNIFRWDRAGWGQYTQNDPYLQPSAEDPNQYAYARQNPTRFKDRFGLFAIQGTCDCGDPLNQNIAKAVAKACSYTKKPACADLVKNLSPAGNPLDQCLAKRCFDDTPIKCDKSVTGACGSYSGLSKTIYLFQGHSLCPSAFKELGYAPTIFHEAIHSCGLFQEPYNNDPLSDAFNEIMKTCTGYKEK